MTTIAHKQVTAEPSGPELVVRKGAAIPSRRAARRLSLVWRISRDAAGAAGLAGSEGGPVELVIRLPWKRGVERVHAALIDGERSRELEVQESIVEWTVGEGLLHLDIPGLIRVTVQESPWKVLYARTDLLSALGVGGGRYEFESGALTDAE